MSDLFGFGPITAEEIGALALLSRQTYDDIPGDDENENIAPGWINITGQLGLDSDLLGLDGASYIPESNVLGDGGEAVVYRNNATNTVAIAFQGTGDAADVTTSYISTLTIPEFSVVPLYSDLISALDSYLLADPLVDRLLLTGQSIGGTLAQRVKSAFSEGRPNISEISGVTFANPALNTDSDILHIGIEGDPVYALLNNAGLIPDIGPPDPIQTTGLRVQFAPDVPFFLGSVPLLDTHDPQVYADAIGVLSGSIFANSEAQDSFIDTLPPLPSLALATLFPEMTLDSNILVTLDSEEFSASTGTSPGPPLFILGGDEYAAEITLDGNGDTIFEGGEQSDILTADQDDSGTNVFIGNEGDDILIGGNRQDLLIGGDDSDTLIGGIGPDLLIGGRGDDTINGGEFMIEGGDFGSPDLVFEDFVYYAGSFSEYETAGGEAEPGFLPDVTVTDTVNGRDGVDTLSNVELIVFGASGDVIRVLPAPPIPNGQSFFVRDNTLFEPLAAAFNFNNFGTHSGSSQLMLISQQA